MANRATEFSDLVRAYRRRAMMQSLACALLSAFKLGAVVLVTAACLRLPWPAIPPMLPAVAGLLAFAAVFLTGLYAELLQRIAPIVADTALHAGSLLVSALELEAQPGRHDRRAAVFTMQRARAELPAWRAAIREVLRLPSPRAFLLPLALLVAGLALLALRPATTTHGPPDPRAEKSDATAITSRRIAELRSSLQPAGSGQRAAATTQDAPGPPGARSDRVSSARDSAATVDETTPQRAESASTIGDSANTRAVSGQGSRAGYAAATDDNGSSRADDLELEVTAVDIERSGNAGVSMNATAAAGFAADRARATEGAGMTMPPAQLATGAHDYELTPAERGYFERYRRQRETSQ